MCVVSNQSCSLEASNIQLRPIVRVEEMLSVDLNFRNVVIAGRLDSSCRQRCRNKAFPHDLLEELANVDDECQEVNQKLFSLPTVAWYKKSCGKSLTVVLCVCVCGVVGNKKRPSDVVPGAAGILLTNVVLGHASHGYYGWQLQVLFYS